MNARYKPTQTIFFAVVLPTLLLTAGTVAFFLMGSQSPKQAPKDGKDSTSKLQKLPIVAVSGVRGFDGILSLDVSVTGTVVPFRQITLACEVAGRVKVKSEACKIGHFVHQGDVLFELDPKDFELDVDRLQAMRDSEYAQQRELDQEIDNARKSLELADEELALQEKELKRLESLPPGFASATELDQARRLRITSANQRLTFQNQIQLLETRRTRIKLSEKLAAAQLEQARVNLERTKIKAPIDGVIVNENVQTDSFVQKGATLCLIEDTQSVEVSCNLRTDQLLLILEQNDGLGRDTASRVLKASSYELPKTPVTVSYRVAGNEDAVYEWKGHLNRYEGIGLDTQSRTVPVRILVDNPRDVSLNGKKIIEESNGGLPALVRGMFVDCRIHTKPTKELVLIPKLALKPGNQVWKFEKDNGLIAADPDSKPDESSPKDLVPVADNKTSKGSLPAIQLNEWNAGWIKVIRNVKVINVIQPFENAEEFWVAEARDDLQSGVATVVSPMANLIGDGSDKVRTKIDSIVESADSKDAKKE